MLTHLHSQSSARLIHSKNPELWAVVRVFGFAYEVTNGEVSIDLSPSQETREYSNWPLLSQPSPFEAGDCMVEVIVVIDCMAVAEMVVKRLHVPESC